MKLAAPLIVGCVMIASTVLVQATAVTAIIRLVRRQVPRANAVANWVHNVGVFARALLLIVAAQLLQIAAWAALFVACGEFDVPFIRARSRELAGLLPRGRYRELPAMAHQPYLEDPGLVADLLLDALAAG